jgi:hypothetical protein
MISYSTPGYIPKGIKVSTQQRYLHTYVYHSTVHNKQDLSRCPSTDEWIKKIWYIYTMEFYSDIKKNEIMLFVTKWMEPWMEPEIHQVK